MTPLVLIASAALLAALIVAAGYPLLTLRTRFQIRSLDKHSRQLQEHKEQLYAAIKELEFDRQLGKISPEDHDRLHRQLEREALEIIRQLDELNGRENPEKLDASIEHRVLIRRGRARSSTIDRCPSCQAEYRSGDLFCPQCGARMATRESPS